MTSYESFSSPFSKATAITGEWRVVAKNKRVNRDWEKLSARALDNCQECYKFLKKTPTQKRPGRVFPLKGKKYKGAWEYEVTKGDRLFYVPDAITKTVIVFYAGEHPKKNKIPPPPSLS